MTVTDALRDTAMPESADTPPMIMTTIRIVRVGATTEVATRATDVRSGEKTPTRTATVAPAEKNAAPTGAETVSLPQGEIRNGCRQSGH